jgi:hypothetical protein
MFVITLNATYDWIMDSGGSITYDVCIIMVQLMNPLFHKECTWVITPF